MSDQFDVVPTLTLDPMEEQPAQTTAVQPAQPQSPAQAVFDESMLTAEERKMVDDFANKIELSNSNLILQYGSGAQKKMADFTENTLESVRSKDLGEVGDMLTGLVTELKSFDVEEEEKGIFGFFKRSANKVTALKAKYDKAEVNIQKICGVLENHQIQLMKDVALLDKMYELNKVYFKELSMYILAGQKKLKEVRETQLPALMAKAKASGLPEDAQAANDLASMCDRFEKKLHDLDLTRMVSIQTAPQIRMVQGKIQTTLVNTIPLWKNQMVLALGIAHSQQAAAAQRQVTDMTNELLRKNSQALKMATVETARESERGIVDIETLRETNQNLISTLDEVIQIQQEGRQKRADAEQELRRIEGELKQKLLDIRG